VAKSRAERKKPVEESVKPRHSVGLDETSFLGTIYLRYLEVFAEYRKYRRRAADFLNPGGP